MNKISAVIITLNEERNILRCINSLKQVADEVILIDSNSRDQTRAIAESCGSKVFICEWKGYSDTKNYGHTLAQNDWILSLDADEELSPDLIKSILKLKESGLKPAGFNRLTNYAGHWVRHGGWYPDFKFRLFNRNEVKWEGKIHEKPVFIKNENEVFNLKGDCYHYSFYSVEEHKKQAEKFVKIQAQDLFEKGVKSNSIQAILGFLSKFMQIYFFKAGFLDGLSGFRIAYISAHAARLKHLELIRLSKKNV